MEYALNYDSHVVYEDSISCELCDVFVECAFESQEACAGCVYGNTGQYLDNTGRCLCMLCFIPS